VALSDYQKDVDDWIGQYKEGYWSPHEILARMTEEAGEVARLVNHLYGPKKKKGSESEQELGEELADVIWAIACMANSHNIDLDEAFKRVLAKAYGRDNDRFEKKDKPSA